MMSQLNSRLLREVMQDQLEKIDVHPDSIEHVIEGTVSTSLRGVDSHGVNNFPHYYRSWVAGRLTKQPVFQLEDRAPGFLVLKANHAVGHHAGVVAMDSAIERAREQGIAVCKVDESSHFGAAAYFALRAAHENMIGMAFTNADALVKAYHAKGSFFGTNPICFTAPLANEEPLCIDMATSLVSWNKIKNYRREGQAIPDHWAYDAEGRQVTDPNEAKSLSPIGDYKGFILGMMVDILCATLTGGVISKDMLPMFTSEPGARREVGHFFLAMDLRRFSDLDFFKQNLQSMVDRMRMMEMDHHGLPVMAPGDPEKLSVPERLANGIPVHPTILQEFLDISPTFMNAVMV